MANHLLTNVGVYAFVIKDKKLLMLHKPNDPIWLAIGGRMSENESSPIDCLKREVKEEIGEDVIVGDILDAKIWSINGKNHRIGIFYICALKNKNAKITLSEEHDEYKFFTCDELVKMSYAEDRGKTGRELFTKLKKKNLII